MISNDQYRLSHGTVQCYVARLQPFFMYHFGRCQYDTAKNIISESIKSQAAPIVDKLNSGEMTEDEAKKALDKIWY